MKSLKKSNFKKRKSKKKKLIGGKYNEVTKSLLEAQNSLETLVGMHYNTLGLNTITKQITEVSTGFQPRQLYGQDQQGYYSGYGQDQQGYYSGYDQSGYYGGEEEPQGFLGNIVKKAKKATETAITRIGSIRKDKNQPKQEVKKKPSIKKTTDEEEVLGVRWIDDPDD